MLAGVPDMRGIEAIQEGLGGMMEDPNFELSFEADSVVASRSGDVAYELGSYLLTVSDPEGNPVSETGHYVVVWEKRNGDWKVVVDAPVSNPPEE